MAVPRSYRRDLRHPVSFPLNPRHPPQLSRTHGDSSGLMSGPAADNHCPTDCGEVNTGDRSSFTFDCDSCDGVISNATDTFRNDTLHNIRLA